MQIKNIIKLMRPKHYLKNILLFVSIVFDRALFQIDILSQVIGGFIIFSLLSSVVYIINDIRDVEADRQHEVKCKRPIASGAVSISTALVFAGILAAIVITLHILLGFNRYALLIMVVYFIVNLSYSLGLKNIPFIDIALLVSGFLLRVLYGAAIINSSVSKWVCLTVISLSFYLGLGKRRNELQKSNGKKTRQVLQTYSYAFLDKFMYLCLTLAIAFYALWSADTDIIAKYGTDKLIWTVPLVILLVMKYSANVESDSHGDPVDVIVNDKLLLILSAIYGILMICLIYHPI